MFRLAVRISKPRVRYYGQHVDHDDHPIVIKQKEEYLKIAREWPSEYFSAENYRTKADDALLPEARHWEELEKGHTEGWSSPFWTKLLAGVVGVFALYRLNEFYFDGKTHPITKFSQQLKEWAHPVLSYQEHKQVLDQQQEIADNVFILTQHREKKPYVNKFPGMFERASDRLIEVGSQVDISSLETH
ncbi:hypothetical protein EDD86DRAFT_276393 [Gorgonomyces haynaldii]|nr:hypothetical protein EDD86DRAFT_276393 [Gorgonomyces haynaldii]